MARVEIDEVVLKSAPALAIVAGASVQVNHRSGGAATIYQAETGTSTRSNPLSTDSAGRIEGWIAPGSYNLVVSGATIATYTQPFEAPPSATELAVNARDFGATGDGTTNDTVALQAFIDEMQDSARAGYLPEGDYRFTQLVWDAALPFTLRGAGKGLAILRPSADAGASQVALNFTGEGSSNRTVVENLSLIGPGVFDQGDSARLGTAPCAMHGLRLPGGATLRGVEVLRFNHNIRLRNDHHRLIDCQSKQGYYNVYLEDQTGHGNLYVEQCELEMSNFASFGVSRQASLVWSAFRDVHFGLGPYAIYLEPGTHVPPGGLPSLQAVTFDDCSFEWLGNGLIYDEDGDKTALEVLFHNSSNSFSTGPGGIPTEIAASDDDYAVSIGTIVDLTFDGGLVVPAAEGLIEGRVRAENINVKNGLYPLVNCLDDSKRLLDTPTLAGAWFEATGVRGRLLRAASTVARYDLVAFIDGDQVSPYNEFGQFHVPVGVAFQSAAAGEITPVVTEGKHEVKTDETITFGGDYAVPVYADSRAVGKVRTSGNVGEPVVGALTASSASGRVEIEVKPSGAKQRDRSCHLGRTAAKSVATATFTDLDWTLERSDAPGWHAANAAGVVVNQAGTYLIAVRFRWANTTVGSRFTYLKSTGGDLDWHEITVGGNRHVERTVVTQLAAGDQVYVQVYQDSGGSVDIQKDGLITPEFQVVQVGP